MIGDAGKAAAPESNPYFLGVVLNLSDSIADACKLDMFGASGETFEQLQDGAAIQWLGKFRKAPELAIVADEELAKSKQIFEAYFSNRKFN
jgi:hypothetical protein